jgi:hypothetical protein
MSQASKVASSVFGPALLGLCVSFAATTGCKKDEPPPPLPTATTPVAAPTPTTPVEIVPDPEPSAAPSASAIKKTGGTGAPAQSFASCCSALLQNAASAPEPNKTYLTTAANMCSSMVAAGKSGPGLVGTLQGLLRGAGMPSACVK